MNQVAKPLSRFALVAFGTVLALVALEVGMRAAGFAIRAAQKRENARLLRTQHHFRILCIGESTTAGESDVPRYPEILQELLNRQGLGVTVVAINMGRAGALTGDLVAELESEIDAYKPDAAVVMMGINDGGKTLAYGTIIEPGRDHWYGTFRLYKLYRLARHKLLANVRGGSQDATMALGEGIRQTTQTIDEAFVRPGPTPPQPTPPQPEDEAFLQRVDRLIQGRRSAEARQLLEERLAADPGFAPAYVELARILDIRGERRMAHDTLVRGAEAVTEPSILLQSALAVSYGNNGETERAIEIVIEIRREMVQPSSFGDQTHFAAMLAFLYEKSGQLEAAERTFLEMAEKIHPGYPHSFNEIIEFYERHGRHEEAEDFRRIRRKVRDEYVNPETMKNYRKIMDIARTRGIQLYAVQYPGRNIDEVKRLLERSTWPVYVDNGFFEGLVEENGFETYYIDAFAGDFGHLTAEGNYLLAENIARSILEHSFGRELADVPLVELVGGGFTE